jgi:hypothetical protein
MRSKIDLLVTISVYENKSIHEAPHLLRCFFCIVHPGKIYFSIY